MPRHTLRCFARAHAQLAERLYAAIRDSDAEAFGDDLSSDSTWDLTGRSALAGVHRAHGAILLVLRGLCERRPIRADAYDVARSE